MNPLPFKAQEKLDKALIWRPNHVFDEEKHGVLFSQKAAACLISCMHLIEITELGSVEPKSITCNVFMLVNYCCR